MPNMNKIEVCLTPELIHQHDLKGKIAVAVDIFRATSCMVAGIANGVPAIHPVKTVEECLELGKKGMITAGERGGIKVEGFDIGNSPFEYLKEELKGRPVAASTTNGTRTILASLEADEVLIGAFLNIGALAGYLKKAKKDLVIHCAGWKGTVNIEDALFAGALIDRLQVETAGDAALIAHQLFAANRHDMQAMAKKSAHARRISGFGAEKDIAFCMTPDLYAAVPVYGDGKITLPR